MCKYFLFGGHDYYPSGGWNDFMGAFNTEVEALTEIANKSVDWWHIVNMGSHTIVRKGRR